MATPIIDALTRGRPVLGGILRAGKAAIQSRLATRTDLPPPVAATIAASENAGAMLEIAENPNVILTGVKSSFFSKINWTQFVGPACSLLAIVGLDLTPEQVLGVVTAIQTIQSIVTWVLRTWFTHSVTAASADRAVAQGKAV